MTPEEQKEYEELEAAELAKSEGEKSLEDSKEELIEDAEETKEIEKIEEDSKEELIDCFEVVGRFYVTLPDENGVAIKRIAQIGEIIDADYISDEIISLNLVKKV